MQAYRPIFVSSGDRTRALVRVYAQSTSEAKCVARVALMGLRVQVLPSTYVTAYKNF
jgi:hypothetical protein